MFGHSVKGRPLRALEVGDRASAHRVLVVGCVHGNECAGTAVVSLLARSPARFDLWLVADLNPDGHARGTRGNAHGVDLNRNFGTGWVARPRGDAEYGGPRPWSEPETRAIRGLVRRLRPDVTIWFHQPQTLVRAWAASVPAARRFARAAGMPLRALAWPAGAATRWQNAAFPGTSAFVVELPPGSLAHRLALRLAAAVRRQ